MSVIGGSINLGLVLLVVLTVAGTAGATALYQDSAQEIRQETTAGVPSAVAIW